VELRLRVLLEVGGRVWVGRRRQDKGRGGLQLVLERRLLRRAAGERRAVGARGVDGLQIILSEQVERAEHLVVLDVERAGGLEVALEGNGRRWLHVEFLGGADLAELLLLMLGRDPWRAPRSAAVVVVVVVVVVLVGGEVLGVVLCTVVEELRHGGGVLTADRMESVRGCAEGR